MKLLANVNFLLATTLIHAPSFLAAPTSSDVAILSVKRGKETTIVDVKVSLNSAGVPILGTGNGVGSVKQMSAYEEAGKKAYDAYAAAVSGGTADTTTTTDINKVVSLKVFPAAFTVENAVYRKTDPICELYAAVVPELKYFAAAQLGFNFDRKLGGKLFCVETVTNVPSKSGETMPTILKGAYDKTGFVQIGMDAFKDNDKTAKTDKHRLPVNELSWQTAMSVAGSNAKNLQVIFLTNIQNMGFWAIAAQNYKEANIAPDTVAVWEPKDKKHTVWFERLLGSDNIHGKILALTNHHTAIGNKKIARVVTIPRQAMAKLGATGATAAKFTAALVLEG